MKKVLFYSEKKEDLLQEKIFINLSNIGFNRKIEYIKYSNKNDYFFEQKDHRIYNEVLNYCENNKDIEFLLLPYLIFPEYLLMELKQRKKIKTKIIVFTCFSWWHNSEARSNVFYELLKIKNVKKIFYFTIDPDNRVIPKFAKKVEKLKNFIPLVEPIKEDINLYRNCNISKEDYSIKDNEVSVLFLGSNFFGKGLDIFMKSLENVNLNNIKILISSNENKNHSFDENKKTKYDEKIIFKNFSNNISEYKMIELFTVSDVVVLPYRRNYEFGSSSVSIQAFCSNSLIIAPNIYPFNYVINKYKLGFLFELENYKSLSKVLNSITMDKIKKMKEEARFKEYLGKNNYFNPLHEIIERSF
jgi:hypothetical protein